MKGRHNGERGDVPAERGTQEYQAAADDGQSDGGVGRCDELRGTQEYHGGSEQGGTSEEREGPSTAKAQLEWERGMWQRNAARIGMSVEAYRDTFDLNGWRERERLAERAEKAQREPQPGRSGAAIGGYADKGYRQINVKLSRGDFDGVVALASHRGVAPSTMARMLLRSAVRRELGE